MKTIKSLVLGSAAALVAMSGAQAADLPLKAKAVEYVRICSLYGAGFYYIPGTDTCIKLGGYLRVDVLGHTNSDANGAYNSVAGANNRFSNAYTARSREDFNIDTRTATEYGVVRTFFDATFSWTSGSTTSASSGNVYSGDGIAGGSLGVYYAFIQFAGFTMGKAVSIFDTPWQNYPGNSFDALVGGGGTVTGVNQLTYTADFGQGMSLSVSAEDPTQYGQTNVWNTSFAAVPPSTTSPPQTIGAVPTFASTYGPTLATGAYGIQGLAGTAAPDLIASFRVDQAWGLFQASLAGHDIHPGYYGSTETSGHPGDKWGWAGQLAVSIKNIPTGPGDVLNLQAVYTDGATRYNFQSLVPTTFAMYGSSNVAYQSLGIASVADAVYGKSGGVGTSLSTVTSWGLRGGFTHNWNPNWNTSVYGAYAQLRYGSTGAALVCANFASAGFTGTCDPNFNIGQVGTITRWTPVKNLTFAVDVLYTMLDQKFSGTMTIPSVSAVAKPTATYEFKDQNTASVLIRAQRNW